MTIARYKWFFFLVGLIDSATEDFKKTPIKGLQAMYFSLVGPLWDTKALK